MASSKPLGVQIYESGLKYLGTPFHEGGRVKDGLDCGGLFIASLRDLGYEIPDLARYSLSSEYLDGLLSTAAASCARIDGVWAAVGDLHVFHSAPFRVRGHCGIVGTEGKILHVTTKVVEDNYDRAWNRLRIASFRFPRPA